MNTHMNPGRPQAILSTLIRLAAVIALLAAPAALCRAQYILGPFAQVSGVDPYANSTADHPSQQPGHPFGNSTVEPWFSVNPINPLWMVATYQQDRWSPYDGGSRGLGSAWTNDGGVTWNQVAIPGIGLTTGGIYERDSDPWNSFAPNGDLYEADLCVDVTSPPSAILVNKSTDGGQTYQLPITIVENGTEGFNDKESVTADPFDSRYAYVVWDRNNVPLFSRTTDSGKTWSAPLAFYDSPNTIDHKVVVSPNGTIYDFFEDYTFGSQILAAVSLDRGVTWLPTAFTAAQEQVIGIYDPVGGQAIRDGAGLFPVTVDKHNGNLYVAWMDARFSSGQIDEIAFSGSTDGGATWSKPIKVNKTPTDIPIGSRQALIPSIAVADDGTICVAYYDLRNTTAGTGMLTDRWAVFCHPSSTTSFSDPNNWGNELRLTQSSFDFHQAPYSNQGLMVGDYMHMEAVGNDFVDVFGITSANYPSIIVSRRMRRYTRSDFNSDSHSDLVFQNPSTGQLAIWYLNNNLTVSAAFVTPAQDPHWQAVGVADLNGDGHPDIVFQNPATGQLAVWYMNNNTRTGAAFIYPSQDPSWKAVGVTDQTGDGRIALFFQNPGTGQMAVWYLSNNYKTGGSFIYPPQDPSWKAVGVGDFNGDGQVDIVFQNPSTGQLALWYMNGNYNIGGAFIYPNQDPVWQAVGVADLNGDGHPDIIFQNRNTGQMAVWYLNNNYNIGGAYIYPKQDPAWKVVGPR